MAKMTKMTKYDVVFVQSGTPTPPDYKFRGTPLPRGRIELGVQLYLNGDASCLFMIGTKDQVHLMKEYAQLRMVPDEKIFVYAKSPTTVTDIYHCFKLLPEVGKFLGKEVRTFAFVTNEVEYKTVLSLLKTFSRLFKSRDIEFEVLGIDSAISEKKKILRYGITAAKKIKNAIVALGAGSPEVVIARDEKLIPKKATRYIRYLYDL